MMKRLFSLRLQLALLALAFLLIFGATGALGQSCLEQCYSQLVACRSSPDPVFDCEAVYDNCVEGCIGQH